MSTPILLASGSYLKNFILEKSRLEYESLPADIDESVFDHLDVRERVVMLAYEKCRLIAELNTDRIVIGADTLTADVSGSVFTKPKNEDDPFEQAMLLSGQRIEVYTGCCIYTPQKGYVKHLSISQIKYQKFTRQLLKKLVKKDNPQIRSGALGVFVDAPGFTLIESVRGSYTGMLGLPMEFIHSQIE